MTFEFKSHPNKHLKKHLQYVAENSKRIINQKDINLTFISKELLAEISYLVGICHDFGKYNSHFQKYIRGSEDYDFEGKKHSLISSFFAFVIVEEYCTKNDINNIFPFISSFVIRRHHGNLNNFGDCLKIVEENNEHLHLEKQIKDIYSEPEALKNFQTLLPDYFDNEVINEKVLSLIRDGYKKKIRELSKFHLYDLKKNNTSLEIFLIIELLYSILVDCDKKDAANLLSQDNLNNEIPSNIVEEFIKKNKKENPCKFENNEINNLKDEFLKKCVNNEQLKPDHKIYSISAPTGIGKTYASFATALKLKNYIKKHSNNNYKIEYILPFTTIIEQNYEEFRQIMSNFCKDFEIREHNYLLKHHYLAVPEKGYLKKVDENCKKYDSKSYLDDLLFIKSWDAKVVVSTYVQLLHTIIGGKNSFMNKFHNIVNSIVILDEVQSVPLKYWEIVRDLFKELSEKFNVYFIFVTATQPLIFSDNEIKELASPEKTFNHPTFNRVTIKKYIDKKQTINDFYEFFKKKEINNLKNRYLLILNTKKSSLDLYSRFKKDKEKNGFYKNYLLIYLSTNLTPKDREKKISKIIKNNQDSNQKYIVITTQLVEAGVDISSDVCYRDMAPLDSIIQSAGRCNRFGEIEKGEFYLIKLYKEETGNEFSHIYGKPILDRTEKTINENKFCDSTDFYSIAKKFFENCWTKDNQTKEHSEKLYNYIKELDFHSILSGDENFKFIETYPTHSIFILDNESEQELELYKNILKTTYNNDDEFGSKKKGEIKKQRKKLQKYIIEITPSQFSGCGWFEKDNEIGDLFYILRIDDSLHEHEKLYSEEFGFNLNYDSESGTFVE